MATIDYGIDLGTTNSSIVSCINGDIRIFQTVELMTVTPSVVFLGKSGRMLVGKKAYDAWPADPQNTQAEFKRWMGFSDKLQFPAAGRDLTAEELSAEVLKSLRADVRRATGVDVTACVITVPAAFGSLQCEATGKAAKLAGFLEAPLLQEPIAAAIAYGATAAGEKAQRWLVFDLGGGTLDIAVVSTRNGRLAVLEHQGNNRLGGKDIDRLIADTMLMPAISGQFQLPTQAGDPPAYNRLHRHLTRIAEQAKIALSTADSAPVDIFNIGADAAGNAIEASLTLTRADMELQMQPLLANCLELAKAALAGARLGAADIDRVLLVGGPTQMPAVRNALKSLFGEKLDHSLDPMTVVAQGAALYASTVERTTAAPATTTTTAAAATPPVAAGVAITLNHERASGTLSSPLAGSLPPKSGIAEIKIDSAGGVWSSGWLPVAKDRFVTEVHLTPGKPMTQFAISAHTSTGAAVALNPANFSIAFMLPMAAPPLPHTIAVELSDTGGRATFDAVFKRHTPLPAEARRTYRADRTLRPSDMDATLPIKFWEIEVSQDPSEKWWAGCVHIHADRLKRPLTEGSEIELTIKIDKSRKLTVDAFIPSLNQGFSDDVYVPDPPTARGQVQQQLDTCFDRLNKVFELMYAEGRDELKDDADTLQAKLEFIAEQVAAYEKQRQADPAGADPDALLAPTENLRKIRTMIAELETALAAGVQQSPFITKVRAYHRYVGNLVSAFGNESHRESLDKLTVQMDRYIKNGDHRGLKYVQEQMWTLGSDLNVNRPDFWAGWHDSLKRPGQRYVNSNEAADWLRKADDARARNDLPALRNAVNSLLNLRPPEDLQAAHDQEAQSGLKN